MVDEEPLDLDELMGLGDDDDGAGEEDTISDEFMFSD